MTQYIEEKHYMGVSVIGAGSWGGALALHLGRSGRAVKLWDRDAELIRATKRSGKFEKYLKGAEVPAAVELCEDFEQALSGSKHVVIVVPSVAIREVAKRLKSVLAAEVTVISTVKGLEAGTLKTMTEVLAEELSQPLAVLSGPSFALEVAQGLPTAVTIASKSHSVASDAGALFHTGVFRAYTSTDVTGVELGGALKNIYAIAAGVVDSRNMGNNARAALLTRGLAEMGRLIVACGGSMQTVFGLSGMGDLILTATSDLSRNRRVGLALGAGKTIQEIRQEIGQAVEGVETAEKASELAKRLGVETPIIDEIARVVAGQDSVDVAIGRLLARAQREEF